MALTDCVQIVCTAHTFIPLKEISPTVVYGCGHKAKPRTVLDTKGHQSELIFTLEWVFDYKHFLMGYNGLVTGGK